MAQEEYLREVIMGTGKGKSGRILKLLKYLGITGTAVSALVGAVMATMTLYDTVKAKAGYKELSEIVEETTDTAARNREEIRFLYKTLLTQRTEPRVRSKFRTLPKAKQRKPKAWDQLVQQKEK